MYNDHHKSKNFLSKQKKSNKFSLITIESIYFLTKKWLQNKYYGNIHGYIFFYAKLVSLWNTYKTLFIF